MLGKSTFSVALWFLVTPFHAIASAEPAELPHLIRKDEVLTKIFKDYVQGAGVPDPADFSGPVALKCRQWALGSEGTETLDAVIAPADGDLLTLSVAGETFLLAESENGLRGTAPGARVDRDVRPRELLDLSGRLAVTAPGSYEGANDPSKLLHSIAYQSHPTTCLTQNRFKRDHFFIERGIKSRVVFRDREKKEIAPEKVPSVRLTDMVRVNPIIYGYERGLGEVAVFGRADVVRTLTDKLETNHSLPASTCFRDFVGDVNAVFRMTHLAVCSKGEPR